MELQLAILMRTRLRKKQEQERRLVLLEIMHRQFFEAGDAGNTKRPDMRCS